MFSGDLDANNAYVDVQSGSGGTEAQDWAEMLLRMYLRWAESHNFKATLMECSAGDVAGMVETSTVTIHGDGYRSRFGYAMVVLDFNLDGVDDLVIASPGYSGFDVHQNGSTPYGNHDNPSFHLFGRVYVLFGQRSDMFPTSVAGNKTTYIATSKKLRGLGQTLNIGKTCASPSLLLFLLEPCLLFFFLTVIGLPYKMTSVNLGNSTRLTISLSVPI